MKPDLIVMLTHNDITVSNAVELFETVKTSPVKYWGFKNVGLHNAGMHALIRSMKSAGKTVKLEVVSLTEEEGMEAAKLAVNLGVDVLMGTQFFESINEFLKPTPVKYVPFAGKVHGHPNVLDNSVEEIVQHVISLEEKGVDGIDLLTYRYTGDPEKLLKEVVKSTNLRVVSAGSIDSFNRIDEVGNAGAWAFTIGTALFDKKFRSNGSFSDNLNLVTEKVYG